MRNYDPAAEGIAASQRDVYEAIEMMKIDKNRLYYIDNGQVACGEHIGRTPMATGICRDGEPLVTVREADAASDFQAPKEFGTWKPTCETCGKSDSYLQ